MSEQTEIEAERSPFNWTVVFFISLFLGFFGIDRFYVGKKKSGVVKLLTFGGSGIWWLVDLIIIATGKSTDASKRKILNTSKQRVVSFVLIPLAIVVVVGVFSSPEEREQRRAEREQQKQAVQTSEKPESSFTDSRDGKKYKTVKIGSQTWMAENLNYEAKGSKCYENNPDNCTKYGRLYDWNTALKVCPSGWHLPNGDEWQKLVDFAGGKETAGKKLKAKDGWRDKGNGTDSYGFSALPGGNGVLWDDGNFRFFKNDGRDSSVGFWWSASEYNAMSAYDGSMDRRYNKVEYRGGSTKTNLVSVRCIQTSEEPEKSKKQEEASQVSEEPEKNKKPESSFTDSRDSKKYRTVKIGSQTWMAENLNYDAKGSKCYENSPGNCTKYGRLYNWNTALKVCPSGWHLPNKDEWQKLVDFAGGKETAGKKLKAKEGWVKKGNSTDSYGFSALPGGFGSSGGFFGSSGNLGDWWSASAIDYADDASSGLSMNYDSENANIDYHEKPYLLSVRCLQN
jgi:uncharacterized protein (TIGR02145 family)